jgi:hypothetical protein
MALHLGDFIEQQARSISRATADRLAGHLPNDTSDKHRAIVEDISCSGTDLPDDTDQLVTPCLRSIEDFRDTSRAVYKPLGAYARWENVPVFGVDEVTEKVLLRMQTTDPEIIKLVSVDPRDVCLFSTEDYHTMIRKRRHVPGTLIRLCFYSEHPLRNVARISRCLRFLERAPLPKAR